MCAVPDGVDVAIEIIKGAALLLALCMLQSFNLRILRDRPGLANLVGGLLFGFICVVGMMAPLEVGLRFIFAVLLAMPSEVG